MSNKVRIAFAVLAGYYLGRRRKLRMAAALAAAGLAGRARAGQGGQGGLLAQGIKALGSSAELGQITDRLRGDLMEVGKAAAVAATSRQIDSLTGKLQDRAEALRTPAGAKENGAATKRTAGKRAAEDEDVEDEGYEGEEEDEEGYDEGEDDYADEEEPEEESEEEVEERAQEEPAEKKPPRRPRPVRRASPSRR